MRRQKQKKAVHLGQLLNIEYSGELVISHRVQS